MAIFKVEGGHRLHGSITPQGAKNEALQILCATLLTPRTGHGAQHSPDPRRHAAHRTAAAHGRRGRTTRGGYIQFLRPRNRFRLPPHGGLPATLHAPARLGDAHRPHAGALRRGLHTQTRRRQNRPAEAGYPLPRVPEAGCEVRFRHRRRIFHGRRPRVERNLHAAGRSIGDRYGQHRDGRRDGQGLHDDLQRRLRALPATAVQDAQPHGRTHLGHRLEPADHRGRRVARRHGAHAAARHDRGGQLHRHGRHEPVGTDDPQRIVREPGHHPGAVRPHGHPFRAA